MCHERLRAMNPLAYGALALLAVEQIALNVARCQAAWYAFLPLIAIVSVSSFAWLAFGNPRAALASTCGHMAIVAWFDVVRCQTGDRAGSSGFVGGLGALYALIFCFGYHVWHVVWD